MQEDAAANKMLNSIYNPTTGQLNIPDKRVISILSAVVIVSLLINVLPWAFYA